ncbi:flocculation protein FLO11-like isoform X2 [Argentina anserina]|uniref:flocculation protein FLO11-like isoform X2 n=1 Tax=Argentina anserina TaxID=57926 RepID=UPI0021765556|nr:flocculation protein FLO11-like isoform X2 [Potentilla anserina]
MEDSDSLPNSDLHPRRLSLIDVSCEDDSLIDSFTGDFKFSEDQVNRSLELFGGAAANKLDAVPENLELDEQAMQPLKSLEPEVKKKKGKYNLRESIAWNSAFLTGPGVLDAEELSSMIDGDKSETRMLPGIQEEVYRSTDTISTVESDTLTLESVEANLFEDVRASIQRSSNASKLVDESTKVGSGVPEDSSATASKGVDSASQDKGRSRLASKKTSIDVQKPGILRRQASRCSQVLQSVSSSGESTTSLLKRPKVLGNPNPSSSALTKRASTGGALLKIEKDSVKSTTSKGAPVPKAPLSARVVPKPRPSTKTTTLGAPARREAASSFNSSGGTASNNINKSPFNSKRKTDSRTDNTPSSASTFKTSPRIESRNKSQSGKSLRSSNLIPVTKLLSSISPASSVSEWSSESSRASLDTVSLKSGSVDFDAPLISDMENHAKDLSSLGHETQASGLLRRSVVKAPMERNGAVPPTSKPSGLRLPSPKIGFFDGVKSAGSTPNGSKQPHQLIPSISPKSGTGTASLTGGQSKGHLGTLQPARTVTKVGSKKLDIRQMAVNMKPTSSVPGQHSLKAAKEVLTPSRKSISPKVDCKVDPKTGMKNQLKDEKTGTEGHGIDIKEEENCFVEKNTSVAISIDQVTSELKDTPVKAAKVTPINGDSTSLCEPFSTTDADQKIASVKVGKVAVLEPHNVKHDSHSLNAFEERKESQVEEQVHNLSRQVGAMDTSAETQQILVGESLSSTQFQQ